MIFARFYLLTITSHMFFFVFFLWVKDSFRYMEGDFKACNFHDRNKALFTFFLLFLVRTYSSTVIFISRCARACVCVFVVLMRLMKWSVKKERTFSFVLPDNLTLPRCWFSFLLVHVYDFFSLFYCLSSSSSSKVSFLCCCFFLLLLAIFSWY